MCSIKKTPIWMTPIFNKPTVVKYDKQENQSLEIIAILGKTKAIRGDIHSSKLN
jgi:hypothetical protein